MTAPATLRVELGARSYDIVIGPGLIAGAGASIAPFVRGRPAIVVTDRNVAEAHLPALAVALDGAGVAHRDLVLPPGEATKGFATLENLIGDILDLKIERRSVIVAFGGGVIGDLAGFAASIVLRGIDFIQIPTTLLAQIDSSVGGKTGINTRHGKNLVGAFYQPRLVLADTGVLDTLPKRELLAGYAEIVKYALIDDPAFFDWLEVHGKDVVAGDPEARRHAILTSCKSKAAIVAQDERESGMRALLNLGHTFGHALEAEAGYGADLLHGEAVALGTLIAHELSVRLGLCPAADLERIRRHFAAVGLPTRLGALRGRSWPVARLLDHMKLDKKVQGGKNMFILSRGIGKSFVTDDVSPDDVARVMADAAAA